MLLGGAGPRVEAYGISLQAARAGQRGRGQLGWSEGLGPVWGGQWGWVLFWGNGCEGKCGQRMPGDLGCLEGELGARSWRVEDTRNEEICHL